LSGNPKAFHKLKPDPTHSSGGAKLKIAAKERKDHKKSVKAPKTILLKGYTLRAHYHICEFGLASYRRPFGKLYPLCGLCVPLRLSDSCGYLDRLQIAFDQSVAQTNDTARVIGYQLFMGYNDYRVAGSIQYLEKRHNLFPGS
jgi:hypothetical protein